MSVMSVASLHRSRSGARAARRSQLPTLRSGGRWDDAELREQAECVEDDVVLRQAAVSDAVDPRCRDRRAATRRGDAEERPAVDGNMPDVRGHEIAFREQLHELSAELRERSGENADQ